MSSQLRRKDNDFANAKRQCLEKSDKSSAGRWDAGAIEICELINTMDHFYTTSSCAGRCFLYQGQGFKSTDSFRRFRLSHESISDASRYFDLSTIESDPTGGGDEILGSFNLPSFQHNTPVWLRYEPFILHVACRSLSAAHHLMEAARPTFKNVGLTTWNNNRYLVAIWGDEGLEMPITDPKGDTLFDPEWLKELVHERHVRNRRKVERFADDVRRIEVEAICPDNANVEVQETIGPHIRSYDVIGDVALFHADDISGEQAESLLRQNKAIKIVALRESNLKGVERSPGRLRIIAGPCRTPLMTTHKEYGIQCVVDLENTFFSARMNTERRRICQAVEEGDRVLVLFSGVGMDALQIAGTTGASKVTAIESNPVAVACAKKGISRNKVLAKTNHLEFIEGDVLKLLPSLQTTYHRIIAPRPKEGDTDGQRPDDTEETIAGGADFLAALLKHLVEGGSCHWYDFCADFEFPEVPRTKRLIIQEAKKAGYGVEISNVVKAGSVAMRQLRVCVEFRVFQEQSI